MDNERPNRTANPHHGLLFRHLLDVTNSLITDYKRARSLDHGPIMGDLRESFLRQFLLDHLPNIVTVETGLVIDHRQERSLKQDIIVGRGDMPKLTIDRYNYFFIESAQATIEIESNLSDTNLFNALNNIQSVRALEALLPEHGVLDSRRAYNYIFSYEHQNSEQQCSTYVAMLRRKI